MINLDPALADLVLARARAAHRPPANWLAWCVAKELARPVEAGERLVPGSVREILEAGLTTHLSELMVAEEQEHYGEAKVIPGDTDANRKLGDKKFAAALKRAGGGVSAPPPALPAPRATRRPVRRA